MNNLARLALLLAAAGSAFVAVVTVRRRTRTRRTVGGAMAPASPPSESPVELDPDPVSVGTATLPEPAPTGMLPTVPGLVPAAAVVVVPAAMGSAERQRRVSAWRFGSFRLFAASGVLADSAQAFLYATVAWQVYEISGSATALGLLGIARFLPSLALSMLSGVIADRFDRKNVLFCARLSLLASAAGLLFVTASGSDSLLAIYALVSLNAVGWIFEYPTKNALLPLMVPETAVENAVAFDSAAGSVAVVLGPISAGLVIASLGIGDAYLIGTSLLGASALLIGFVRPLRSQFGRAEISFAAVKEGLRFVFHRQVLLAAMLLDLLAVVFGGAAALVPVYADILGVGAIGYGVLEASISVGAMIMGFAIVLLPPIRRAGRAMIIAVICFGIATIVFGVSRSFPLSLVAYAAIGAADMVSYVIRHTMIPMLTPDELRGRVGSVNLIFVDTSNHLGAGESGFVAGITGPTVAVAGGGIVCILAVGFVALLMPELRRFVYPEQSAEEVHESTPNPAPAPSSA